MSIAITSDAPRRSISKAQKPSNVPTSRQRLPSSEAGNGICGTTGRVSCQPGVSTPGASSIVWYHWCAAISARRSGCAVSVALMGVSYQPRCRPRAGLHPAAVDVPTPHPARLARVGENEALTLLLGGEVLVTDPLHRQAGPGQPLTHVTSVPANVIVLAEAREALGWSHDAGVVVGRVERPA